MRNALARTLGAAVFAVCGLALASGEAMARDRDMPGGSWQQSCRNARMDGDTLRAECRNSHGRWYEASLELNGCRRVANIEGNLRCEGGGGWNNGGWNGNGNGWGRLPGGSWQQSCRNGRMDGDTLRAECRNSNGRWYEASLELDGCRRVANIEGNLRCEGRGGGWNNGGWNGNGNGWGRLPGGSWQQSCRNGRMDGDTLRAECRNSRGRWYEASLDLNGCRRVANIEGNLRCE